MTLEAAVSPHPDLSRPPALAGPGPAAENPTILRNLAEDQTALNLPARTGLYELQHRVAEDDSGKWDLCVPRDRLALASGRLILPEDCTDEHPECLTLSPWAMAQACHRLGIPGPYFARCPAPLQDAQFNHWAWRQDAEPDEEEDDPRAGGARKGILPPVPVRERLPRPLAGAAPAGRPQRPGNRVRRGHASGDLHLPVFHQKRPSLQARPGMAQAARATADVPPVADPRPAAGVEQPRRRAAPGRSGQPF